MIWFFFRFHLSSCHQNCPILINFFFSFSKVPKTAFFGAYFFHFFFNIKPPTLFGKFLRYGKMHCFLSLHQAPTFQAFPCDAPGPCPPLIFWLKKLEFFNRINYFTKFKTHFWNMRGYILTFFSKVPKILRFWVLGSPKSKIGGAQKVAILKVNPWVKMIIFELSWGPPHNGPFFLKIFGTFLSSKTMAWGAIQVLEGLARSTPTFWTFFMFFENTFF